jgi:hypothetical protein
MLKTNAFADWPEYVQKALIRLNIPANVVAKIEKRQRDVMAGSRG